MRLTVSGDGAGNIGALDKSDLRLDARVVSDDGALVTVLGLDRLTPADAAPSRQSEHRRERTDQRRPAHRRKAFR